jgi:hypothetical protein
MAQLFNVPADYKRLLNFLRKYQCHLPVHPFRAVPAEAGEPKEQMARVAGE